MEQQTKLLDKWCAASPIIPVITLENVEHAVPLANALEKAGLNVLEITMRTPCALECIQVIREQCEHLIVGAGSVLSTQHLQQALNAGSQFIVSPGAGPNLWHALANCSVPVLAGVATISEVLHGYELGFRRFKFFPAEINGGAAALKAFSGPISDVKFCPTGGVTLENMNDYLVLNNVFAIGGTWIVPKDLIAQENWDAITQLAEQALAQARLV
ncbi:bifunctional 4-hydroxy-2-oxoglutarate aldolase/2-dehydro-3-deoxy-phosphogluconate aldolase [Bermanella sp. R86510]|uniref:bifunctional 4-hydroxy-2-oxoglutarate aldolase/2-dehydro-3-deoxy-phosphogluconate aldolase n=1 Tax=unclassified Bermanella TaxID=2627862 RepID=UPI0037C56211